MIFLIYKSYEVQNNHLNNAENRNKQQSKPGHFVLLYVSIVIKNFNLKLMQDFMLMNFELINSTTSDRLSYTHRNWRTSQQYLLVIINDERARSHRLLIIQTDLAPIDDNNDT